MLFKDAVCCLDYIALVIDEGMSVENWWNDMVRRKSKYLGEPVTVPHKLHI